MKTYIYLTGETLRLARKDTHGNIRATVCRLKPEVSLGGNLDAIFAREPLLEDIDEKSDVEVVLPGTVSVVPLSHFEEEDCEALYKYCLPEAVGHRVFYDVVPAFDAVLLFGLEEQTCQVLQRRFPTVHYMAALTPILTHLATLTQPDPGGLRQFFVISQGDDKIVVVGLEDKRLLVANDYHVESPADAAYYILSLAIQLAGDAAQVCFHLLPRPGERTLLETELRHHASHVDSLHTRTQQGPFSLELLLCE